MRPLRSVLAKLKLAVLVVASWAAVLADALAQRTADTPATEPSSTDYTLAYSLVMLGILLGLLCVVRPGRRRQEAGPQQYVAKEVLVDKE